jgi:hypothetical protein
MAMPLAGVAIMSMVNIKRSTFRHICLALGVAGLVISGLLVWHGQLVVAFVAAFLGLTSVSVAETDVDVTASLGIRSFGKLLAGRAHISTLGLLCDIASYFCLAAAIISWFVLR